MNRYDPYLNDNFNFDFDLTDERTNLELLQSFKFENLIKERAWKQNSLINRDNVLEELRSTIIAIIVLTNNEIEEHDRKIK